jgi:hypothetical protein
VPPAVALLNYISCGILQRIFSQTAIFAGFSLYYINFVERNSEASLAPVANYRLCHRNQCKSWERCDLRCQPPLSTTPVVNLLPVFFSSVMHLELRISSRKFEKIRKGAKGIISGKGKDAIF